MAPPALCRRMAQVGMLCCPTFVHRLYCIDGSRFRARTRAASSTFKCAHHGSFPFLSHWRIVCRSPDDGTNPFDDKLYVPADGSNVDDDDCEGMQWTGLFPDSDRGNVTFQYFCNYTANVPATRPFDPANSSFLVPLRGASNSKKDCAIPAWGSRAQAIRENA